MPRLINRYPNRVQAIVLSLLPFAVLLTAYLAASHVRLVANPEDKLLPAPATLVERLSEFLPLVSIELSGEETRIDETMFWAPINDHAQEHIWLRSLMKECLVPPAAGTSPPPK